MSCFIFLELLDSDLDVYHINLGLVPTLKDSPIESYRQMWKKADEKGWIYPLEEDKKYQEIYNSGKAAFILSSYRFNHRFAHRVKNGLDQKMQMFKVD